MKSQEQTGEEYLEGLKKQIAAMDPIGRVCSMATINLANIIVALINNHHWAAIEEMNVVCNELFSQAAGIKDEEKQRTLQ